MGAIWLRLGHSRDAAVRVIGVCRLTRLSMDSSAVPEGGRSSGRKQRMVYTGSLEAVVGGAGSLMEDDGVEKMRRKCVQWRVCSYCATLDGCVGDEREE